jgi:hypothetical protein
LGLEVEFGFGFGFGLGIRVRVRARASLLPGGRAAAKVVGEVGHLGAQIRRLREGLQALRGAWLG